MGGIRIGYGDVIDRVARQIAMKMGGQDDPRASLSADPTRRDRNDRKRKLELLVPGMGVTELTTALGVSSERWFPGP